MISFDLDQGRFNYRVAAVVIDDGHLLACREMTSDYWFLPGGRCEMMESSIEAVQREIREEFDDECQVDRLLWFAENFFHLDARTFHEIGLYFHVSLSQQSAIRDKSKVYRFDEGAYSHEAHWFALSDVLSINLVPAFLRTGVQKLPTTTQHILIDEIGR